MHPLSKEWHSCGTLGDIACFSFNGNKIITTGGGGMIVTDNEKWARRAKYLTTQAKDDPMEFVHNEIGYNYRLVNIAAAMGCAQLEKLNEYIAIKRRIAATYTEAFKNMPGLTPMREAKWAFSIFWMFTMLVDEKKHGKTSRELLQQLAKQNIQARPLWQPMHLSPAHRGACITDCAVAGRLSRMAISLPCSVGLTRAEQRRVIDCMAAGI
jgi:perosamine synthetase